MDLARLAVAEAMVLDFSDVPTSTVVRVVSDCSETHPGADLMFVEAAARAQLRTMGGQR